MNFPYDTEANLGLLVALVNSGCNDCEELGSVRELNELAKRFSFSGMLAREDAEAAQARALREEFRQVFDGDPTRVAELVNHTFARCHALPQLVRHDNWDWHLHALASDALLCDRIAIDICLALVDVMRDGELNRLKVCQAPDCNAVLVDFSRNRSKRFCDIGNCANRTHVAAYRARQTHEA